MATQLAVANDEQRPVTPLAEVQARVAKMGAQLKSVLPAHIDISKFQRVAMTAIQMDPALLEADRTSLYTALTKAAQDGLLPDKREGALVIYKTKIKIDGRDEWVNAVQWMPMVAGILKKIRQSGEVASISAHAVYENDQFDYMLGDDEQIHHKPTEGTPGKIRGAYCIVTLKDGFKVRDYMPWWRIEKAKAVAKTKFVWDAWPDEMAIKTVIKHIAKVLPQSTDIEAAFTRDDTAQFEATAALLGSRNDAPPPPLTAAVLLGHDPDTGEIESGRTDEQHGDQHDGTEQDHPARRIADDLIARIARAELLSDVANAEAVLAGHEAAMPDALVVEVRAVAEKRRNAIKGAA